MHSYSLPRDTHNKNRNSIPVSIRSYGTPQDTNYIGITITDQEDNESDLVTTWIQHKPDSATPQSYRHSFNNLNDLTNLQQHQSSRMYSSHSTIPIPPLNTGQLFKPQSPDMPRQGSRSANIPLDGSFQQPSIINRSSLCNPCSTQHLLTTTPVSSNSFASTPTSRSLFPHQPTLTPPKASSNTAGVSSNPGAFRKVSNGQNLIPSSLQKPSLSTPFKPLLSLTKHLNSTYQKCNHAFQYNATRNPRRVLTKPNKPGGNDGYDNEEFNYILYVNDILGSTDGHRYMIMDVLGCGTFGQVVKCKNTKTHEMVAVKVIKNKLAYFDQSMMEVTILEMVTAEKILLNQRYDADDQHHILRLKDNFIHRKHLCLVFELMSVNLYELIKRNQFRGLSTNLVRVLTAQILDSLTVLNEARVIHCDLKPENILLQSLETPTIKVIDFGSACHEVQTMYTYIQSRFYRSPEVLVGLPYTGAIDMWSLGCIAAELFLGLPLFPGSSEYNQVSRIVDMLGLPPAYMIEMGKTAHYYFNRKLDDQGQKHYDLKTMEQYAMEQEKQEQPSKRYFKASSLSELITTYPMIRKDSMSSKELEKETQSRHAFVDFLQGLLNLNHFERWSPQQAKQHPFITGEQFNGPFKPSFTQQHQSHVNDQLQLRSPSVDTSEPLISHVMQQVPISISGSTDYSIQHQHDLHQTYLSPSYSSLPNFHSGWLSQQHGQKKQQSSPSNNSRLSMQHEEDEMGPENNTPGDSSNHFIYNIPQVLETSGDRSNVAESTFIPSSPLYLQNSHNQSYQHNHLSYQQRSDMNSPPSSPILQQRNDSVSAGYTDSKENLIEDYGHHSAVDISYGTQALTTSSSLSSSNPINITASTSANRHMSQHYPVSLDTSIHLSSIRVPSQATQQQTSKDQSYYRNHDSVYRNRPTTWRSGTRNMSSIDLERDADWMEEQDSPLLESLTTSTSTFVCMSSTPSPLPFAEVHLTTSSLSDPQPHPHRRSHSSTLFADVVSPFNSGTSVLSRSSMASNVASLHRRVRGHPPVIQAYHRQDLEWDGIHTLLPY